MDAYNVARAEPTGFDHLKVMVHRLRAKLSAVLIGVEIQTIWGHGYRLIGDRDMADYCPHCGAPLR